MGNKIIVEFDRRKLKKMCPLTNWCKTCNKEDEHLLRCHIIRAEYKIKGQNIKKNKYIAYLGDILFFNINYLYFEQYA